MSLGKSRAQPPRSARIAAACVGGAAVALSVATASRWLFLAGCVLIGAAAGLVTLSRFERRRAIRPIALGAVAVVAVATVCILGARALVGSDDDGVAWSLDYGDARFFVDVEVISADVIALRTATTQWDLYDVESGAPIATFTTGVNRLVDIGGGLIAADLEGEIVVIDREGEERWRRANVQSEPSWLAVIAAARDGVAVFAGNDAGGQPRLVAIAPDGSTAWEATGADWVYLSGASSVYQTGMSVPRVVVSQDADGSFELRDVATGAVTSAPLPEAEPEAFSDALVLWAVPAGSTDSDRCGAAATDGDRLLWEDPIPCIVAPVEVTAETLDYVPPEGRNARAGREPVRAAIDMRTGAFVMNTDSDDDGEIADAFAADRHLVTVRGDTVRADPIGEGRRWEFGAGPAVDEIQVALGRGAVAVISAPTALNPMLPSDLRGGTQVTVVDPATGSVLAWIRCPGVRTTVPVSPTQVAVVCGDELHLLDGGD